MSNFWNGRPGLLRRVSFGSTFFIWSIFFPSCSSANLSCQVLLL
jgi:hypothetical protein